MSALGDLYNSLTQGKINPNTGQPFPTWESNHPGGIVPYLQHVPMLLGAAFGGAGALGELGIGAAGADTLGVLADTGGGGGPGSPGPLETFGGVGDGAGRGGGGRGLGSLFEKAAKLGLAGLGTYQGAQQYGRAGRLEDFILRQAQAQQGDRDLLRKKAMARLGTIPQRPDLGSLFEGSQNPFARRPRLGPLTSSTAMAA